MKIVVFADISDKVGSAVHWWLWTAILSLPLVWAAARVTSKAGRLVTLCLGGGLAMLLVFAAMQEAFYEGEFRIAVKSERGRKWIAHRITSGSLPLVLPGVILALRRKRKVA